MSKAVACTALCVWMVAGVWIDRTAVAGSRPQGCADAQTYVKQAVRLGDATDDTSTLLQQERLYRQAIQSCPVDAIAHNNLGDIYEQQGWYAEAIESYKRAASLQPTAPYPYFGLGDVFFRNGQYQDAIRWYDEGLEYAPQDALALERRQQARARLHSKVIHAAEIIHNFKQPSERPDIRGPSAPLSMTFGRQIPFDTGQTVIRQDAQDQLNELGRASASSELTNACFEIAGHTIAGAAKQRT